MLESWCDFCHFWQSHFLLDFGLFQAETFCQIKNGWTSQWPMQLQETQVQLQHILSDMAGYFSSKIDWVALLKEDCTNNFQTCIYFPVEWFSGVIIFKYGPTGKFFLDGIKCLSMFRSPYKWYNFLEKLFQAITKFCQSRIILVWKTDHNQKYCRSFTFLHCNTLPMTCSFYSLLCSNQL